MKAGTKNIKYTPFVKALKILLSLLDIELGLMKNFEKAMNQDGAAFKYFCNKFPVLAKASKAQRSKAQRRYFFGSQINKLLKNENFVTPCLE